MANPDLDFMMQMDPTGLPEEKQRAVADRLRRMATVGALGSTSQLSEVADPSRALMKQAFASGKGMGDDKRDKRREANYLTRTLANANSRTKPNNMASKDRERLFSVLKEAGIAEGMLASFKDEYSNQEGLGLAESIVQKGMTSEPNFTTAFLDNPVGGAIAGAFGIDTDSAYDNKKALEEESTWWGMYDRLQLIPQRAAAFGATLTPEELASWRKADITERMTPEQIRANLAIRVGIERDVNNRIVDMYEALGFNQKGLDVVRNALDNGGAQTREHIDSALAQAGVTVGPEGAGAGSGLPAGGAMLAPEGVDAVEWGTLSPQDQKDYMTFVVGGG